MDSVTKQTNGFDHVELEDVFKLDPAVPQRVEERKWLSEFCENKEKTHLKAEMPDWFKDIELPSLKAHTVLSDDQESWSIMERKFAEESVVKGLLKLFEFDPEQNKS
jgi:hypothetical protein